MKIAIIGSGISAVTAAKSFIDKKCEVFMFEGGSSKNTTTQKKTKFFSGLGTSPKFNNELLKQSIKDFNKNYNIKTKNFFSTSALTLGGLSNFWGGGLEMPDIDYLKKYKNYNEIVKEKDELDEDLGLEKDPFKFYDFFFKNQQIQKMLTTKNKYVSFEKLLLAINQFNINDNEKQKYLKECQYSNPNIIYNAKNQISNLQKKKLLNFFENSFVDNVITNKNILKISINNSLFPVEFDKIIISCGTVGSTILVSKILKLENQFQLLHTPVAQLVYFSRMLNKKINIKEKFGIALLLLKLKDESEAFKGSFMQASQIENTFFGIKNSNVIFSFIKNFIFVGNIFFPQNYSNTILDIKENSATIKSQNNSEIQQKMIFIKKKINSFFKEFGLIHTPFLNCKLLLNGSDAHYTSSIHNFNINGKSIIDQNCQLIQKKNLYVLDNSIIASGLYYPSYFTMMYIKYLTKRIISNDKKN